MIWRKAVSVMEGISPLKSDRQTLETGEHLGFLDRETQERTLLLYLERNWLMELEGIKENTGRNAARLYTSQSDGRSASQ